MKKINNKIIRQQKAEITEHFIYNKLSLQCKNQNNKNILQTMAKSELKHYNIWKNITNVEYSQNKFKVFWFVFLSKIFGLSFTLKLMEGDEEKAIKEYDKISKIYPETLKIIKDEEKHERNLIRILNDERLSYAGAIVLGLNDALVELTGTLAGFSLVFTDSKLVGITGLIMGIAASLSMASSGYLSSKENEKAELCPIKSAIYTGVAYIITVLLLVIPYFIFKNIFISLAVMIFITIFIIASYTFYISIAKELNFKKRFFEMVLISISVTIISFLVGLFLKANINI